MTTIAQCARCGTSIQDGSRYCPTCGAQVDGDGVGFVQPPPYQQTSLATEMAYPPQQNAYAPAAYPAPPNPYQAMPPWGAVAIDRPCPTCGRGWGPGIACQFCRQVQGLPSGIHLSSPGKRLGAYLLEGVLFVFTLGIGWLIWELIVWGRGQTPAKQVLGMRVANIRTGTRASWGKMFLRSLLKVIIIEFSFTILMFWLLWDKNCQELWDKAVDTIVVEDPHKQL